MDEFIGVVKLFAGNFAPEGWMFCQGQILPISRYTALFSLLGTTYGGDGQATFALPDLRGRVPVGFGQGTGLSSNVMLGEKGGVESVTLTPNQMPAHTHQTKVVINAGNDNVLVSKVDGAVLGTETRGGATMPNIYTQSANSAQLRADAATITENIAGGSQPHENRQPYLGLNYIICLNGIYPPRS